MTDDNNIARCHECKRPLAVIDYHSEHLTGCMTCNLWGPPGKGSRWKRQGSSRTPSINTRAWGVEVQSRSSQERVRFGSLADMLGCMKSVRFTPETDILRDG